MKVIKETTYKGTRILLGNEKRELINKMITILQKENFTEISLPVIQYSKYFDSKVGEENNNMMYNFKDRGNRDLCLAPEYTAIVQELSKTVFKDKKDLLVYYVQECFRGEKPQAGRYRQFTQLGVEVINPTVDYLQEGYNLQHLAMKLLTNNFTENDGRFEVNNNVTRGLDYYEQGKGFEIVFPSHDL